jgi:predicted GNAT superfamily acetyltransferase
MFKKILLSAVALTGLVLGASQAEASYGCGGYGYNHYRPHYSYSYSYCHYVRRPVTIRVCIYKTIYRSYKVC